ncbi:MAG: PleD family two-component system response regulator [Candidatus Omnitrophota bacterium]
MKKILVVDDEKEILAIIGRSLEISGYSVLSAATGREALESARVERPDLIVLDLVLPDADYVDVAKNLKDDTATKDIPVIFISGLLSKEEAEERGYFEEGGSFLSKPFKKEELLSEIDRLL